MSTLTLKMRETIKITAKLVASAALVLSLADNTGISVKVDSLTGSAPSEYTAPLLTEAGFVLTAESGEYIQYEV